MTASKESKCFSEPNKKSPDDVVIICALRSPLTRATKGLLKDTAPEAMFAQVLKEVVRRSGVDPKKIEDVQVGNAIMPGSGAMLFRASELMADLPVTVPCASTNRLCSSGLEACAIIASKIKTGLICCGVGGGAESMSMFSMNDAIDLDKLSPDLYASDTATNVLLPMGQCSEILTEKYGITRKYLDEFAAESYRRASAAQKNGWFKDEIVPIHTTVKTDKGEKKVTVTEDDGIREGVTAQSLSKLKPAFRENGLSTAGNSSQTTDGAAAVLLCSRKFAQANNLKVIAKFITHAVIGVPPDMMGIGPAEAIPIALANAKLSVKDIDVFEINEAFASQCGFCADSLKIDRKKLNPNGGAIALGHPLGCTGARQFATLLNELRRLGGKFGVISMCIGSGQGAAGIVECEY